MHAPGLRAKVSEPTSTLKPTTSITTDQAKNHRFPLISVVKWVKMVSIVLLSAVIN